MNKMESYSQWEKGKFYYQGDLDSAKIPWDVDILYELDGEEIDAKDLAGKRYYDHYRCR